MYLTFMAFLTTALALAAKLVDPRDYSMPTHGFRLFCEIVTFIWIIVTVGLEIRDFVFA